MTKDQKIKILSNALKFYRRIGTRVLLNPKKGEIRFQVENGTIADNALLKAGVSKRLVKKPEYVGKKYSERV